MPKKYCKTNGLPKRRITVMKKSNTASMWSKIALYMIPVIIIGVLVVVFMKSNTVGTPTSKDKKISQKDTEMKNSTTTTTVTTESVDDRFKYQMNQPQKGDTLALLNTSKGDIKVKLFPKEAPKAVENFTKHAKAGYYNGLTFHRVINDFMIQTGDPKGTGSGGESIWKKPFEDEFSKNLHNVRGALSMANSGRNTNGSQFFIVQNKKVANDGLQSIKADQSLYKFYLENGGTPWLDNKHTVFGQVYQGLDIVDNIASVKTKKDKPITPVLINKIEILIF